MLECDDSPKPDGSSKKLIKTLTLKNQLGLHARAAAALVNTANKFVSDIQIHYNNETANCKSIMGILMLSAPLGAEIQFVIEGEDAHQALHEIERLIENKFGEPE
ncbi:MAG: HPr family phosphocarrier protein [Deltaproteobacteria bacterium]|nr:HPr family phosphocarrier protein [Deltaproteobacteria bacterium]